MVAAPILIDLPSTGSRLAVARAAGWRNWEEHVAAWQPAAPQRPTKKTAPRGVIPPGPWYRVAWLLLTATERARLEGYTRQGRHVPTSQDSPVQALSSPSKMPGYSWAITAGHTCPGAVYGPDTICGECYAGGADGGDIENANNRGRGYIARPHVRRATLVREQFCRILCATASGREAFAAYLVGWIRANVQPADSYFRIHDAGDFYAPAYIDAWRMIAEQTPDVRYWAPTRSWHIAESLGGRWASAFAALNALPNMTVRPSALKKNAAAPDVAAFAAGSGVKTAGWNCPASEQQNACRACRACWDARAVPIYYHAH